MSDRYNVYLGLCMTFSIDQKWTRNVTEKKIFSPAILYVFTVFQWVCDFSHSNINANKIKFFPHQQRDRKWPLKNTDIEKRNGKETE